MKKLFSVIFIGTLLTSVISVPTTNLKQQNSLQEKPFVIVVASYNNKKWYKKNLDSITRQDYKNYRIIYTDDASPDETGKAVQDYITQNGCTNVILLQNSERQGAMANIDHTVRNLCAPHEIVALVDGDDWLAHDQVLKNLNRVYSDPVWLTYGQFQYYPCNSPGWAGQIPNEIIDKNAFRGYLWLSTHLKTFYAGLFQHIQQEDLMHDGTFFTMTYDIACMMPMLEMAGHHSRFIPEVSYIYNSDNEINDHKVNYKLQCTLNTIIRARPAYMPLDNLDLTVKNNLKERSL
jgi:glycosyltransferase involved in cell wall biosynthesis